MIRIMPSPDNKFDILVDERDSDSYMDSSSRCTFTLVSVETGDGLESWYGSEDSDAYGSVKRGTDCVKFTKAGDKLLVVNYDGTQQEYLLPINVEIIADGKKIENLWPDGRKEQRERHKVLFTTKYGEPFSPVDLHKDPDKIKIPVENTQSTIVAKKSTKKSTKKSAKLSKSKK
jgi:hypothetical protein